MSKIIELEKESYGIIYMFRNKLTGHRYIGQTRFPEKRIKKHILGCNNAKKRNRQSLIHLAIKEYGIENFEISVLKYCDSQEEMNESEISYILEYNSFGGNGYNKACKGHTPNLYSEKEIKHFAKKSQGKKLPGAKAKYFCVYPARNEKFVLRMRVNRKHRTKTYDTEVQAAEAYDQVSLKAYGSEAILNFPEKREEYLKMDLESIYNFVITPPKKTNKYSRVVKQKNGRWRANPYTLKRYKTLHIGAFDTEEEAAQMSDKIMFYFDNSPPEKLNFPELVSTYDREELKEFFDKCIYPSPNRFKNNKSRGTRLVMKTWISCIPYKTRDLPISRRHETREDARNSLIEYLLEFLKDEPNIENLKHLNLFDRGVYFVENKKNLDNEFIVRVQRFYEHLMNNS